MLALCETAGEVAEFGLAISRARQLFAKIEEAKARGVPLSLLSAAPVRTGNDIFPVRYTVIVIYCGALVQPYILHIRLTCSTPSPIMYYMKYSPPPRWIRFKRSGDFATISYILSAHLNRENSERCEVSYDHLLYRKCSLRLRLLYRLWFALSRTVWLLVLVWLDLVSKGEIFKWFPQQMGPTGIRYF